MPITRVLTVVSALVLMASPVAAHEPPPRNEPSSAVHADTTASATTSAPDPPDHVRRRLDGDTAPATSRVDARIRLWPGRKIPYYETIPATWDWSLDQAIDHWNSAGGRIKFVEVPKSKAELVIGYGDTHGADGYASVGYGPHDFVHLSPTYKKVDEHDPQERVWVGRLFTHELGHVLGFEHTAGCTLMTPVFDFGCGLLVDDKPGYYQCRWIDKKLLKRFIQMYGGRAKRPPSACPIEELPGELRNVTFSGGNAEGKPVKVTWTPPSKVLDGTKVHVTLSEGACTKDPFVDDEVLVDPHAGSWTDAKYAKGTWCYTVQIVNRYDGARPAQSMALPRFAPVPAAPDVGTPTFHAAHGGWHVTWTAPLPGAHLVAVRNDADPPTCDPTYSSSADELEAHGTSTWLLLAAAPVECLTFFVATDWDTVSPGTTATLTVPAGTAPATPAPGARTWDPANFRFLFSWTPPDPYTTLRAMRAPADDPTACPTTFSSDEAEYVDFDTSVAKWALYPDAATECEVLYAVTDWGTRSATGAQVVTQVPAPTATPAVGASVGPYADDPAAASVTASVPSTYAMGVEVLAGTCPAVVPSGLDWSDGYEDFSTPNLWYFYPEPYGSTAQQCVMFTALDGYGQHGPVVTRQFTVAP